MTKQCPPASTIQKIYVQRRFERDGLTISGKKLTKRIDEIESTTVKTRNNTIVPNNVPLSKRTVNIQEERISFSQLHAIVVSAAHVAAFFHHLRSSKRTLRKRDFVLSAACSTTTLPRPRALYDITFSQLDTPSNIHSKSLTQNIYFVLAIFDSTRKRKSHFVAITYPR